MKSAQSRLGGEDVEVELGIEERLDPIGDLLQLESRQRCIHAAGDLRNLRVVSREVHRDQLRQSLHAQCARATGHQLLAHPFHQPIQDGIGERRQVTQPYLRGLGAEKFLQGTPKQRQTHKCHHREKGYGVSARQRHSYGPPPVVRKNDPFLIRWVIHGPLPSRSWNSASPENVHAR